MLMESVVLGLIVGWLRGGRLSRLAELPWRWPALFVLALLLQRLPFRLTARYWPSLAPYLPGVYMATYLVLLVAVAVNYRLPAFWWFGAGAVLNFLVIAVNGGHMPVSPAAVQRAGLPPLPVSVPPGAMAAPPVSPHIAMGAQTRLNFLGDLFFIPPPYPNPRIFSFGDFLMAIGIFWLIQAGMVVRREHGARPSTVAAPGR
ncbi:MAG: DUF5317 domain-containing protein [Limnochordaceae bacterium]|nr:DUF5317 domain-containing protein [Limnochordaceae bacterium]